MSPLSNIDENHELYPVLRQVYDDIERVEEKIPMPLTAADLSQLFSGDVTIDGTLTVRDIPIGDADYDKFIVSDGGIISYRTAVQMLADLGIGEGSEAGHIHDERYFTEDEVTAWRNSVTQTEMGYLDGLTSDLQTQLDAKLSLAGGQMNDDVYIGVDEIRARDGDGLKLYDDGGNRGIFVKDGGNTIVGLGDPAYRFSIGSADGSDQIGIYHSNMNAYFKTTDGDFIFQTDEGSNTDTYLLVKGKGTGRALVRVYDGANYGGYYQDDTLTCFHASSGAMYISALGALHLQHLANSGIDAFFNSTEGETEELKIYGYKTGDALRSLEIGVGVDAVNTASFDGLSYYSFDGTLQTVTGNIKVMAGVAGGLNFWADMGGFGFQTYVGGWHERLTIADGGNVSIGTMTAPYLMTLKNEGQMGDVSYSSGWTGHDWALLYSGGNCQLEVDALRVRGELHVYDLIINQIHSQNGGLIVSAGHGKAGSVSGSAPNEDVTLDSPTGLNACSFRIGDIILVQRFNIDSTTVVKQCVRRVDVDPTSKVVSLATVAGAPGQATDITSGDVLVVIGNDGTTANRDSSIFMSAVDGNNPFIRIFDGVTSWSTWKSTDKTRIAIGNLNGVYGYGGEVYGFAAGIYTAASGNQIFTIDPTYGFRILQYQGSWKTMLVASADLFQVGATADKFKYVPSTNVLSVAGWVTETGYFSGLTDNIGVKLDAAGAKIQVGDLDEQHLDLLGADGSVVWYKSDGVGGATEVVRIDDDIYGATPGVKVLNGVIYSYVDVNNYVRIEKNDIVLRKQGGTFGIHLRYYPVAGAGEDKCGIDTYLYVSANDIAEYDRIAIKGDTYLDGAGSTSNAIGIYGKARNDGSGAAYAGYFADGQMYIEGDFTNVIKAPNGAVDAPTYSFSGDLDTGIYRSEVDTLCISAGGIIIARFYESTEPYFALPGHTTTANAANVYMDSSLGVVKRSLAGRREDKENIRSIEIDTGKIYDLNPISFVSKLDLDKKGRPIDGFFGLIAEEVHETLPNLCGYNDKGEPDWVQYPLLPVLMLPEMKKLRDRISDLEAEVATLKQQIAIA